MEDLGHVLPVQCERRSSVAFGLPECHHYLGLGFFHAMLRNYDIRDQESRDLKLEGEIHLSRAAARSGIYYRADRAERGRLFGRIS